MTGYIVSQVDGHPGMVEDVGSNPTTQTSK